MSPRAAVVGAVALVGAVIVGLVAMGCRRDGGPSAADHRRAGDDDQRRRPRPPSQRPRWRPPRQSEATTSVASTTTTTPTPPTMAPIVTYLGRHRRPGTEGGRRSGARRASPAGTSTAPVIPAGVNEAAELAIPPDAKTLVWYRYGPTPGRAWLGRHRRPPRLEGRQLGTFNSLAGHGRRRDGHRRLRRRVRAGVHRHGGRARRQAGRRRQRRVRPRRRERAAARHVRRRVRRRRPTTT